MPKGPQGQKRPADAIGLAVLIGKIATGEAQDDADPSKDHHREGGKKGGVLRAQKLPAQRRREIAQSAAKVRWGKDDDSSDGR